MQMLNWDQIDFNKACASALAYYLHKFDFDELKMKYIKLFTAE